MCVISAGGIIQHHCDGDPSEVDHAVQVVGYDMNGEPPSNARVTFSLSPSFALSC